MEKTPYLILAEGWLDDAEGIAAYRNVGDVVSLTAAQAEYLVLAGTVSLKPASAAPAKTIKPSTKE